MRANQTLSNASNPFLAWNANKAEPNRFQMEMRQRQRVRDRLNDEHQNADWKSLDKQIETNLFPLSRSQSMSFVMFFGQWQLSQRLTVQRTHTLTDIQAFNIVIMHVYWIRMPCNVCVFVLFLSWNVNIVWIWKWKANQVNEWSKWTNTKIKCGKYALPFVRICIAL